MPWSLVCRKWIALKRATDARPLAQFSRVEASPSQQPVLMCKRMEQAGTEAQQQTAAQDSVVHVTGPRSHAALAAVLPRISALRLPLPDERDNLLGKAPPDLAFRALPDGQLRGTSAHRPERRRRRPGLAKGQRRRGRRGQGAHSNGTSCRAQLESASSLGAAP